MNWALAVSVIQLIISGINNYGLINLLIKTVPWALQDFLAGLLISPLGDIGLITYQLMIFTWDIFKVIGLM